ncbi:MAG: hypothetical protein ACYC1L_19410 [Alphaproteobacteria bacterium]
MKIKVTISGPNGEAVQDVVDVQHDGDLEAVIKKAFDEYRRKYPKAPAFQKTIKVEHA